MCRRDAKRTDGLPWAFKRLLLFSSPLVFRLRIAQSGMPLALDPD
jgi:hypothetical protein